MRQLNKVWITNSASFLLCQHVALDEKRKGTKCQEKEEDLPKLNLRNSPGGIFSNWDGKGTMVSPHLLMKRKASERNKCFLVKIFTINAVSGSKLWHTLENKMRTPGPWSRCTVSDFLAWPPSPGSQERRLSSPEEPV